MIVSFLHSEVLRLIKKNKVEAHEETIFPDMAKGKPGSYNNEKSLGMKFDHSDPFLLFFHKRLNKKTFYAYLA